MFRMRMRGVCPMAKAKLGCMLSVICAATATTPPPLRLHQTLAPVRIHHHPPPQAAAQVPAPVTAAVARVRVHARVHLPCSETVLLWISVVRVMMGVDPISMHLCVRAW